MNNVNGNKSAHKQEAVVPVQHYVLQQPYPAADQEISLVDIILILVKKWRLLLLSFFVFSLLAVFAVLHVVGSTLYSRKILFPTYSVMGSSVVYPIVSEQTVFSNFKNITLSRWADAKLPLADELKLNLLLQASASATPIASHLLQLQVKATPKNQAAALSLLDNAERQLQAAIKQQYNNWHNGQQELLMQQQQQLAALQKKVKEFTPPATKNSSAAISVVNSLAGLLTERVAFEDNILRLKYMLSSAEKNSTGQVFSSSRKVGLGVAPGLLLAFASAFILALFFVLLCHAFVLVRKKIASSFDEPKVHGDQEVLSSN